MQHKRTSPSSGQPVHIQGAPEPGDFLDPVGLRAFHPSKLRNLEVAAAFSLDHTTQPKLSFSFQVRFAPASLLAPLQPSESRLRRDGLWQNTCFEFFLQGSGSTRYFEVNIAPGGDWACYRFDDYRMGMHVVTPLTPPMLSSVNQGNLYTLSGALGTTGDDADFTSLLASPELRVSATAVIECGEDREYWALTHEGEKPDFHLASSFIYKVKSTQE